MVRPRIVSLVPSGTDIVAELGLAAQLVGVSHACDHPASRAKPVLTSSTVPAVAAGNPDGASPAEVDRAVAEAVGSGQPLYRTDLPLLHRLRPDVVITQDVCDVCAVSGNAVRDDVPPGAEVVTLEATNLSGLEADLERVGKATASEDRARAVASDLRGTLERVAALVSGQPRRPAVVLEWTDPPYLGGHWVPELVAAAGGVHLLSHPGERSRRAGWDEIAGAGPDVVVFAPCGFTLAQTEAAARPSRHRLGDHIEVWATDATALFSRCTPGAVRAAAQVLAGILHPDRAPAPNPAVARPLA